jgi:hypothetical protein
LKTLVINANQAHTQGVHVLQGRHCRAMRHSVC